MPRRDGLPSGDREVDALPPATREAIARHFRRRVTSELQVSRSFERLAPWLRSVGAESVVVAMTEQAVDEEIEHAQLCLDLAEIYAGTSVAVEDVPIAMPEFGCDDERLEVALHIAGLCCINETLATGYLSACLSTATAPIAVAAHRAHLREEVDHARLGWAHLASRALDPALRRALEACLPRLVRANFSHWEGEDPDLPAEGVPAHGLPSHAACVSIARDGLARVVLPGFRHVGLDVSALDVGSLARPCVG